MEAFARMCATSRSRAPSHRMSAILLSSVGVPSADSAGDEALFGVASSWRRRPARPPLRERVEKLLCVEFRGHCRLRESRRWRSRWRRWAARASRRVVRRCWRPLWTALCRLWRWAQFRGPLRTRMFSALDATQPSNPTTPRARKAASRFTARFHGATLRHQSRHHREAKRTKFLLDGLERYLRSKQKDRQQSHVIPSPRTQTRMDPTSDAIAASVFAVAATAVGSWWRQRMQRVGGAAGGRHAAGGDAAPNKPSRRLPHNDRGEPARERADRD